MEADEATYNLHIMLRLELEIALVEGSLEVKDLPEAWNARMQDYLGLTPPNDALGVMQDIHWSSGYFGYFSTYALGNLIASQLWERIVADIPDLTDQIRRGEFAARFWDGCVRRCTATGASSRRKRWYSASPARRSTRRPTCATCKPSTAIFTVFSKLRYMVESL